MSLLNETKSAAQSANLKVTLDQIKEVTSRGLFAVFVSPLMSATTMQVLRDEGFNVEAEDYISWNR